MDPRVYPNATIAVDSYPDAARYSNFMNDLIMTAAPQLVQLFTLSQLVNPTGSAARATPPPLAPAHTPHNVAPAKPTTAGTTSVNQNGRTPTDYDIMVRSTGYNPGRSFMSDEEARILWDLHHPPASSNNTYDTPSYLQNHTNQLLTQQGIQPWQQMADPNTLQALQANVGAPEESSNGWSNALATALAGAAAIPVLTAGYKAFQNWKGKNTTKPTPKPRGVTPKEGIPIIHETPAANPMPKNHSTRVDNFYGNLNRAMNDETWRIRQDALRSLGNELYPEQWGESTKEAFTQGLRYAPRKVQDMFAPAMEESMTGPINPRSLPNIMRAAAPVALLSTILSLLANQSEYKAATGKDLDTTTALMYLAGMDPTYTAWQ